MGGYAGLFGLWINLVPEELEYFISTIGLIPDLKSITIALPL